MVRQDISLSYFLCFSKILNTMSLSLSLSYLLNNRGRVERGESLRREHTQGVARVFTVDPGEQLAPRRGAFGDERASATTTTNM